MMKRILILGGTTEAHRLATRLSEFQNLEITTSLAGRTNQPSPLSGQIRSGGFGGVPGLIEYLQAQAIDLLIDATHPFAAKISWNAATAAQETGIPHLLLLRPAWEKAPGDHWIEVETVEAAAIALPAAAKRVFLTVGRQQLAPFSTLSETWFLMRLIDPLGVDLTLPKGKVILDRGPFNLPQERQLLQDYGIDAIVSKNSGGSTTYAKVIAARDLHLPVIMVQRPVMPIVETVPDVAGAITWMRKSNWIDFG
jgi:precorrin-6A/cobalt-precorrin-6A reductase